MKSFITTWFHYSRNSAKAKQTVVKVGFVARIKNPWDSINKEPVPGYAFFIRFYNHTEERRMDLKLSREDAKKICIQLRELLDKGE